MRYLAAEKAIRALVSGRVQGVGFRFFTRSRAEACGLAGWVRNLPDGRVEVRAEGPVSTLESFLGELGQGPPGSRVQACQVEWEQPEGLRGFTIR